MPFDISSTVRYYLHGDAAAASAGEQPHQVLEVRLKYLSRLISRSPAAGIPHHILQETPPSQMPIAVFPLPLRELDDPLFLEVYLRQLLLSLNLPADACGTIGRKIASFVVELAGGNTEASIQIVALVDYIQELWMEPIPGLYPAPAPPRRAAARSGISRLRKEKVGEEVELGDCSVCLNEMKGGSGSGVIKIPCGHVYHESCILTWLKKSNSCPLCRTKLEQGADH